MTEEIKTETTKRRERREEEERRRRGMEWNAAKIENENELIEEHQLQRPRDRPRAAARHGPH